MLEKLKIEKKLLKQLDIGAIIISIIIVGFGSLNIFSATQPIGRAYYNFGYLRLQLCWLILGLVVMYLLLTFDYTLLMNYASVIYWGSIALLLFNDLTSKAIKGQNNWIKIGNRAIQPSEFVKLAMIIMIAKTLEDMDGNINNFKNFCKVMFYAAVPMALILAESDMGLTMVSFFIVLGIVFIAGLDLKVIFGGLAAVGAFIGLVWNTSLIKAYQKARLTSFLNPDADPLQTGYQLLQSKIAIGSGGLLGKGFLHGTRIAGGFVPEPSTDFIFAVIGEEWGFVGALFLILMYALLVIKFIKIAKNSKDIFGSIICVGIISIFLFSILQNAGMTIGIMPISGITLPFVSYGGSSLLSNFIALGLVLNVGMRKKKINF